MKNDVFRKAALERLATADQLDKVMKITSPLSWIALIGVTVIIVAVVIWSFMGELPSTVTANGVVVSSSTATNTIWATGEGTLELCVSEGQQVNKDDVIARINSYNETIECIADQYCVVSHILAENHSKVESRDEIMRISPIPRKRQKQVAVCYVPFADIGKIDYDKPATITLTAADSSYMEGRVINIDKSPTSNKGIEAVVGTDNGMINQFVKDGAVCAVTLELLPSGKKSADVKNDYWWSNKKGYNHELNDKMMCIVKITTKSEAPITKLFTILKDIWGGH